MPLHTSLKGPSPKRGDTSPRQRRTRKIENRVLTNAVGSGWRRCRLRPRARRPRRCLLGHAKEKEGRGRRQGARSKELFLLRPGVMSVRSGKDAWVDCDVSPLRMSEGDSYGVRSQGKGRRKGRGEGRGLCSIVGVVSDDNAVDHVRLHRHTHFPNRALRTHFLYGPGAVKLAIVAQRFWHFLETGKPDASGCNGNDWAHTWNDAGRRSSSHQRLSVGCCTLTHMGRCTTRFAHSVIRIKTNLGSFQSVFCG